MSAVLGVPRDWLEKKESWVKGSKKFAEEEI